ncbi:MAG: S8 family peptidase [Bryobacteraceae bacterium]
MMRRASYAFALAALACWGASPEHPKLSKDLVGVAAVSNVKVIVQWKSAPDNAKHQKVIDRGGVLNSVHPLINAAAYTISTAELNDLANDSDVAFISPDRPVTAKLDYTAAAVNASYAWGLKLDGTGIGVAVIDSGMNQSPDLTENNHVVYNQDFTGEVKPNANVKDTKNAPDLFGHGQHVSGIIASSGQTSSCGNCTRLLKGIAPGASIINLRALNEDGEGTDSMVIAAIEKAIALKNTYNIRVINLSLGRPIYESYTQDPLCQAVEQAWKAGIIVVVAAGNDGRDDSFGAQGYGTITAPGNDPYVITVGAMKTEGTYTRTDDLIASYSSKGPTQIDHIVKPDIVAPGNQVVSLLAKNNATLITQNPANNVPVSYYQDPNNHGASNAYFMLSGTSMAAPVVSGAAADLLEAQPTLTPDQVKALIMQTAYKTFPASSTAVDPTTGQAYIDYYDIFTVGAGYLDLKAALQSVNSVPAGVTAISPTANYNNGTGAVTLSYDPSSLWANQAVWGARSVWDAQSVWGATVLSGSRCVWGAQSVWGAASISSSQSVWGAQAVWGAQSVWGARSVWGATTDSAEALSIAINGER